MKSKKRVVTVGYMNYLASNIGRSTNNYVIIKHYGKYSLDQEDAKNAMATYDKLLVNYFKFANDEMVASYEPFLTIIKNCYIKHYSDISIDEYLEMFKIYELHKPFFKSYIDSGDCERYEAFILDEIEFEKKKILEAMIDIIITLSKKHPMLIMIDNIHMLPKSSISVLIELVDNPDNKNIGILATYNDLKRVAVINKQEWLNFVNVMNHNGLIYEGGTYDSKEEAETTSSYVFESKRAYEYLGKLKIMYCSVEFELASYYLQKIHKKLISEKINIDADCKFEFVSLYAKVLLSLGDLANAMIICDSIKELCDTYKLDRYYFEYYYIFTYTQMYSSKTEQANENLSKCMEAALNLQDDMLIFRAEMLQYMIEMSGWHNIYFFVKNVEVSEEFIEKIKKYKYYNHLANMYIYGYDNEFDEYRKATCAKEFEESAQGFSEGLSIAKRLGNTSLMLKAYRKMAMITSTVGNFNVTEEYYDKYIDLVEDSDEKELAEANNGRGYIRCSSRNFVKSNECYNIALDIFMRSGDVKAVGETLYNMSVNCILAEDYKSAHTLLKTCIRIIDKLRLNDLRVCNLAKLYGLLALACTRLSFEYDSNFYLKINKRFLEHIINKRTYKDENNEDRAFKGNDDELFLHYFVKGLLEAKSENYKKALECYNQAKIHCMNAVGNLFFSYVQMKVAMAEAYFALGDREKANRMIDLACEYAQNTGYLDQVKVLEKMRSTGKYVQEKYELKVEKYTIQDIDALIDKTSILVQNQDMSNHIEFISVWQNILEITNKTQEELIRTAANSFMLNFNLNTFIYIKFTEDSYKLMFSDGSVELDEKQIDLLRNYFETNKSGFVTAKIDKNYEDYKKILDIFGMDTLCSIVCNPFYENEQLDSLFISCIYMGTSWNVEIYRHQLNESEANIFNLLLRQLILAVDKINNINEIRNINVALKESSFTDYLTGLKNRNGFYDSVTKIMTEANESGRALDIAVLYIDLDNFKYYNDTFGHDVGDLVLKEVANILIESAADRGFAVRYGGDEFLIVLIDSCKDEAMAIAKMTLDVLLGKNGYANEISSFLGKRVVIKTEKKLSCSIGVSNSDNIKDNDDLTELLKYADSSLYDIKNSTKSAVKYYEKEER